VGSWLLSKITEPTYHYPPFPLDFGKAKGSCVRLDFFHFS
jgi:hypothetical protein